MQNIIPCWDIFNNCPANHPDIVFDLERFSAHLLSGPALFDPQINGFAGIDFQDPDITREGLEHAVEVLGRNGCSHFLVTLITAKPDRLKEQLYRINALIRSSHILQVAIPGLHLEGPFISDQLGYVGAHAECHTCDPDWKMFESWQRASGDRIRLVTLAPERTGSISFIDKAFKSGLWIALGHTDANISQLNDAIRAGARLFTHLGNACPRELNRHDNIIQRVLALPELMASVIPDGIHLPASTLLNTLKILKSARLVLTTDAMSAAGAPNGLYRFGDIELEAGDDRTVRHPQGGGFAGSCLTPLEGLLNAVFIGGLSIADAWRGFTRLRSLMFPEIDVPLIALPFPFIKRF